MANAAGQITTKSEQILVIEPQNELKFRGPFNAPVTSYMKLTNPSDKRVLFKIKTTAPKRYCVRPNSGVLDPSNAIDIAISLQPFLFDPAEKNKHKFMVQTLFAPDGEFNLDQLWKEIGQDQLMDSKLKCVFEMPVEQSETTTQQETAETASNLGSSVASKSSHTTIAAALSNNSGIDPELQKAAEEVQQLREEESSLKQENLQLLEELIHLRKIVASGGGGAAGGIDNRVNQPNRYTPPAQQQQQVPVVYLALAVLLGLLGIVLGKFLL